MRMLREAAVVAATIGSVGMVGAGVASAGGWGHSQPPTINCAQTNGDTIETGDVSLPLLTTITPGAGSADARNQQNNCGLGIIGNDQESGDATGGSTGLLGA
ncbi:hypothetical protein [Streptomyces sp. WMMB 322]|uniref:hypothetical protein n=1 Tax=Streptomyces sp. WMMB 322 TaxID=1286821 RepID=UPI0006E1B2B6|nr:hypothetical protein [Streptomyces sp. WMMB 322]SCK46567.1 hypothetical protein H180DRAFT_04122 [Streptomyces sp. WMMB 322]